MKRHLFVECLESRLLLSADPVATHVHQPRLFPGYVLDTSFGERGEGHYDVPDKVLGAAHYGMQGDKIVIEAIARDEDGPMFYIGYVRFNSDGTPDQSFGDGGGVLLPFDSNDVHWQFDSAGFALTVNCQTIYLDYNGNVVDSESGTGDYLPVFTYDVVAPDGALIEFGGLGTYPNSYCVLRYRPPTPEPLSTRADVRASCIPRGTVGTRPEPSSSTGANARQP